ncbi:MAG: DUF503 domain-containing protein, partial [Candidatus Omnitrophica bacterium]|nr:DUF503 domain-containing protein [Candidatus Omnitrophota bacterium]
LTVVLFIHDSNSLKEKRMVLEGFKKRLQNNFNVAVAQIGDDDKWQKSSLAIVGVSKNRNAMDSILSKVINFIERDHNLDLIDYKIELL